MKSLKSLRVSKGLTQDTLANHSGMSNLTISNIEQQITEPGNSTRLRIEKTLGARVDWLRTCGLHEVPSTTWEEVESDFRKTVLAANGLSEVERQQFLVVSREYLNSFEELVTAKSIEDSEVLYPIEVYEEARRKRQGK